jgi:hypothetical protein
MLAFEGKYMGVGVSCVLFRYVDEENLNRSDSFHQYPSCLSQGRVDIKVCNQFTSVV